jgi:hypothetical protein
MGDERKVYKVLMGKPEGKRPLGRPRRRWEDGIRIDLMKIGLGVCGLDSTGSGQGPVAGCGERPKERDHLQDQDVGGKMGSEWILGRLAWGVWTGFDWLRTGTAGGLWGKPEGETTWKTKT